MAAVSAIAVAGLGRDYGRVRAVDAIDLDVRPGEFFGFLGPNGAGKTTTIRMLTTLLKPTRGTARIAGIDVEQDALAVRRKIGVVFQETTLDLDLTAEENLRFCTRLYGLSRKESKLRIEEALELFGLHDRRNVRVRGVLGRDAPRARPRPRDPPPARDRLPRRAHARPRPGPAPADLGLPPAALAPSTARRSS